MKVIAVIRNTNNAKIEQCFTSPTKKEALEFIDSLGWYDDEDTYNIAIFRHTEKWEAKYGDKLGKLGMGNIGVIKHLNGTVEEFQ